MCVGQGPKSFLPLALWWVLVIYTYILIFIRFHQTVLELGDLKEKRIVAHLTSLISLGKKQIKKTPNIFSIDFKCFDFESLGPIATEILSPKRGMDMATAADVVWYGDQNNTSCQIS